MKSKIHESQNKYISMRKNSIIILITFLITALSFAQQGINYKAILKDGSGNVLANTFMNVQFTIHQSTAAGTIVYQGDHNYTTDVNGLLILTIGTDSSPSVGTFATINWSVDIHFLQTTIIYSGGTINFDATEFKAVPYAKHAETAGNVFSGDYNDLTNQPTTLPSGLEQITEDGNTGWRLVGVDPNNYGPIGSNATDLSYSIVSSSNRGATGNNSTAMGNSTIASGSSSTAMGRNTTASALFSTAMGHSTTASALYSTAIGNSTTASGDNSIAMGFLTTAPSYSETVIGSYNTVYTPNNTTEWDADDRVFVIGNGFFNGTVTRSNALTVFKNGTITAPSFDIAEITDDKALITKEYADANLGNSGLEQYTDNEGRTGWNLIGMVQSPWIGTEAVNLSYSTQISPRRGALGLRSFAVGNSTTASGDYSTAMGYYTQANGVNSIAMGRFTSANGPFSIAIGYGLTAHSSYETVIGRNSTNYTPNDPLDWDPDDRLFTIGNSPSNVNLSNALIVLKNGTITAPSFSISEIDTAGNTALITKQYADANYSNTSSNLIPIAYGTIESDGNVLSSTPDVTASINAGVITISVNNVTMNVNNTSCSITPYSTAFRTSSIIISGGDIQVRTFNSSGNSAPTTFQFVIYKL